MYEDITRGYDHNSDLKRMGRRPHDKEGEEKWDKVCQQIFTQRNRIGCTRRCVGMEFVMKRMESLI